MREGEEHLELGIERESAALGQAARWAGRWDRPLANLKLSIPGVVVRRGGSVLCQEAAVGQGRVHTTPQERARQPKQTSQRRNDKTGLGGGSQGVERAKRTMQGLRRPEEGYLASTHGARREETKPRSKLANAPQD